MEIMSLCGTTMNEIMMQNCEDKIRVFPAIPTEWRNSPLAFKLLARGGFLVAAERQMGEVVQISVLSQYGGTCRIQNPWPGQTVMVLERGTPQPVKIRSQAADVIAFETRRTHEYVLCRGDMPPLSAPVTIFRSEPTKVPKKLGASRSLGLHRGVGK